MEAIGYVTTAVLSVVGLVVVVIALIDYSGED